VNRASRNVDQLLSQAELQRFSFLEIVESLEERREEWAHLPSIAPVASGEVTSSATTTRSFALTSPPAGVRCLLRP
jgi:hypothetical protein